MTWPMFSSSVIYQYEYKNLYVLHQGFLFGPFSCSIKSSNLLKTTFKIRQCHNYLKTSENIRSCLIIDHTGENMLPVLSNTSVSWSRWNCNVAAVWAAPSRFCENCKRDWSSSCIFAWRWLIQIPDYHSRPWPVPVKVMVVKSKTRRAGLGREQANVPWVVSTHTCSVSCNIASAFNRLRLVCCRDCWLVAQSSTTVLTVCIP